MATRYELEDLAREHDFLGASHDRNARRTMWVVALTSVMMVVEIAAGWITGSMALLADGFHMATHAGALAVAAGAYWFAKRHVANPRFTFGTGKVGDLAGFASALVLGFFAIGIAAESTVRLFNPVSVNFGDAIVVAVIGLAVNLVSAAMLSHGHEHGHDHGHHDHNIRAAYFHVLADALTSVLAIAALVAGAFLRAGLARSGHRDRRVVGHRPLVLDLDAPDRRGPARHRRPRAARGNEVGDRGRGRLHSRRPSRLADRARRPCCDRDGIGGGVHKRSPPPTVGYRRGRAPHRRSEVVRQRVGLSEPRRAVARFRPERAGEQSWSG
jgi:hypothetical protein